MTSYLLTPGDREAVEQGCTCAVIDNHYGRGFERDGQKCFWITEGCPLHDPHQAPSGPSTGHRRARGQP